MDYKKAGTISGKGSGPDQFVETLRGITIDDTERLYAVGDADVKVFDLNGSLLRRWRTARPGHSVAVDRERNVYVGEVGRIERFNETGRLLATWKDEERLGVLTAIGFAGADVLVADATHRRIHRYDHDGKFLNDIGHDNKMKGFLIPNGSLDLSVDAKGIIHATNPGKHRVERYKPTGELLGHFGKFGGPNPEGFSGCCNPTNVAVTRSGQYVVTVKAAPYAKLYDSAGKLLSLIGSEAFDGSCKNMDVATDAKGRIYVVDTVRLQIVVFAPTKSEATTATAAVEGADGS